MIGLRALVPTATAGVRPSGRPRPADDAVPAHAHAPLERAPGRPYEPRTVALVAGLRRRWPLALLCALSAAAAGVWGLSTQPATYRSEAMVTVAPPAPAPPRWAYVPAFETARTARDLLGSARVAALASAALGGDPSPESVSKRVLVTANPDGWQTIAIDADGSSPTASRKLVRAVLEAGLPIARAALPADSRLELAVDPSAGSRVARHLPALVGGLVGLALAAGLLAALLAAAVEDRIRGRRRP